MQPALNPLVLILRESATIVINQKFLVLRQKGQKIYHFGFGQSPFPVPQNIQKSLCDNTDKKGYLPTQGLPALWEAVSQFYNAEHKDIATIFKIGFDSLPVS